MPLPYTLDLSRRRLAHLDDTFGVPNIVDHFRAGPEVSAIGKGRRNASVALDRNLETALDQTRNRVRDECHSALPRREFPRNADSHAAILRTPTGRVTQYVQDLRTLAGRVTHFVHHYGLFFLFAIVCLESAGLWLPGETALIAAAVYASEGHLSIVGVVLVAAAAAIIGDNIGYWLGREVGRRLIYRYGWARRIADKVMPPAERFFARHGGKAVFLARFFGGVRVTGAWMAGITRMSWWRFLFWNASGGIVWAVAVSLIAFYAGKAAADSIGRYGVFGGIGIVGLLVLGLVGLHLWRRRVAEQGA